MALPAWTGHSASKFDSPRSARARWIATTAEIATTSRIKRSGRGDSSVATDSIRAEHQPVHRLRPALDRVVTLSDAADDHLVR